MPARSLPPTVDRTVARLAARQGGLVSRAQLRGLGLGRGAIEHRLAVGRLLGHRTFRGVYAVGHDAPGPRTRFWAAYLAAGPRARLSHRAAADLHDLRAAAGGRVEVTLPYSITARPGLRPYRSRDLAEIDVVRRHGLPVTGVARTLLDLGAVVSMRAVEHAFDRAEVLGILDHAAVHRLLEGSDRRPGRAVLRAVAARGSAGHTATDSPIEEQLLALVRAAGLPEPVVQRRVLRFRADLCWPAAGLIVEADGGVVHATRGAIEHDRERDVLLQNAGWTVLRFTRRQIAERPAYCAEQIATALGRLMPATAPGRERE